ncbi:CHRD domain-containing protein [Cognatilysobacter lacus]|nr:CHRD domain-containing protein [Lysobacter lacus]
MRRLLPLIALVCAIPVSAVAQDIHMRGVFNLVRAPAADVRPPTGEARAVIDDDGRVRVDLVVSGLVEHPTSATLHTGSAGANTEQVARMDVAASGDEARVIGGRVELTPIVAQQLRASGGYIVLHTSEHPDGFLRAQLLTQARTLGTVSNGP